MRREASAVRPRKGKETRQDGWASGGAAPASSWGTPGPPVPCVDATARGRGGGWDISGEGPLRATRTGADTGSEPGTGRRAGDTEGRVSVPPTDRRTGDTEGRPTVSVDGHGGPRRAAAAGAGTDTDTVTDTVTDMVTDTDADMVTDTDADTDTDTDRGRRAAGRQRQVGTGRAAAAAAGHRRRRRSAGATGFVRFLH